MNNAVRAHLASNAELWIFGYGSLMWKPGFEFIEHSPAVLSGYHRSFCIYSHHYRGTSDVPGLVLGLDSSGECSGCAFRIDQQHAEQVVAYLDERELVNYAYVPRLLEVGIEQDSGVRSVIAYSFVADHEHPQYAGELDIGKAAAMIMKAEGIAGLNRDYLINTVRHLEQIGFCDDELHALLLEVEKLTGMIDMGGGI